MRKGTILFCFEHRAPVMPLLMMFHTAMMKFSQSFLYSPTTQLREESSKIPLPIGKRFIDPAYSRDL